MRGLVEIRKEEEDGGDNNVMFTNARSLREELPKLIHGLFEA